MDFMIGQKVLLTQVGGLKEIGTVVVSETGITHGIWVFSPFRGYASDYSKDNVKPLTLA